MRFLAPSLVFAVLACTPPPHPSDGGGEDASDAAFDAGTDASVDDGGFCPSLSLNRGDGGLIDCAAGCWLHPLPSGANFLGALQEPGGETFLYGEDSVVVRLRGDGGVTFIQADAGASIGASTVGPDGSLWFGGQRGRLVRISAGVAEPVDTGLLGPISSVAFAQGSGWASDPALSFWDGATWSPLASPFGLDHLFAWQGEVFGVADRTVYRRAAGQWQPHLTVPSAVFHATSLNGRAFLGAEGAVYELSEDGGLAAFATPALPVVGIGLTDASLVVVGGSSRPGLSQRPSAEVGFVVIAVDGGVARTFLGTETISGVISRQAEAPLLAGYGGLYELHDGGVRPHAYARDTLQAACATSGASVAVGANGLVVRAEADATSDNRVSEHSLTAISPDCQWMTSSGGEVFRQEGSTYHLVATVPGAALNAVASIGEGEAMVGGGAGYLARVSSSGVLTAVDAGTASGILSITVQPEGTIWVAGENFAKRSHSGGWQAAPAFVPLTGRVLVVASGCGVYAATQSLVAYYDGRAWNPAFETASTVVSLARRPGGGVVALLDDGTFYVWDGQLLRQFHPHLRRRFQGVAASEDGSVILVGEYGAMARFRY